MAQLTRSDFLDPVARPRLGAATARAGDLGAAALALFIVLSFSQGWMMAIAGPTGDPDASGLIRAAFLPAYGAALWLAITAPGRTLTAAVLNPLLLLLVGLVFASWSWSIDPGVTLRRATALGFTTLAGLAIGARFSWPRMAEVFGAGFALIALASLLLGVLEPSYGRMQDIFPGVWRGVFQEKNMLGSVMAVGTCMTLAAAALNPRRRLLWACAAGLCLTLLALSTSKTAMLSCGLGLGALALVFLVRRGPAAAVGSVWLAVTVGIGLAIVVWLNSDAVLAAVGKDASLTGRTRIWGAVLRQLDMRPNLGFGYGAVWSNPDPWAPLAAISRQVHFAPRHAHNAWLETRLALGWLGLGVWALVAAWAAIRGVWTAFASRGGYLAPPFLVVFLFTGLTEANGFTYNDLNWVIFCAAAAKMALGERASGDQPER